MKSGYNSTEVVLPEDFKMSLSAGLAVFLEKAMDSAILYAQHAERSGITAKDVILALKLEVFKFGDREGIETDVANAKEELLAMSDSSEDDSDSSSEEEYTSESEDENGSAMSVDDPEADSFCVSRCTCDICSNMNSIESRWNEWVPETPLERSLYTAINKSDHI